MRMPSGDHGSAPVVINVSRDNTGNRIPGVYRIDQARFTMKVKWEIQIKLLEDGQVVDEVIQYVSI
jgi:hypothetical protein